MPLKKRIIDEDNPAEAGRAENLSSILKGFIKEANISEYRLAKDIKMPYHTLHQLITSETICPKVNTLKPIANYFGISIEQLIGDVPIDRYDSTRSASGNHQWQPSLYHECVGLVTNYIADKGMVVASRDALSLITQIYSHCQGRSLDKVDGNFAAKVLNDYLKRTFSR